MSSLRARGALVLLNLALLSTIVWLVAHAVRRATTVAVLGPSPVEYAIDTARKDEPAADAPSAISAALDPPQPPVEPTAAVAPTAARAPEGEPPLSARFRLLLVSEDREDPGRSTAIVASPGGFQRTLTVGDRLEDHEVVHIGLEVDGEERHPLVVVERDGRRQELRAAPRP